MGVSVVVGLGLGALFLAAPDLAGESAVTDPVWLGVMWFVRPRSLMVLVPPLLHFAAGAGLHVLGRRLMPLRPRTAALIAAGLNSAATAVENAYGAGVMGVGWWLIGSVLSAALMFLGIAAARRIFPTSATAQG
ncbi:MAG: hypothetical protein ACRDGT_08600 [Candidatus Limnocylindria bacterium]